MRVQLSSDSTAVHAIDVTNVTSQKTIVSNLGEFFTIDVKIGDVILLSSKDLETLRIKIDQRDIEKEVLTVNMGVKSIVLKEVIINESGVSSESLGIIPYGQKKYTPAERRLYTATTGGGIDGLLNTISGRKAMIKKEIIVEKKEQLLAKIDILFEDNYYIETLKIPELYIKGFQYYCIDDISMANALRAKNKTMVLFLIVKLAENYNEILALESK
ncbi:hypothetical protein SAMN05444372_109128 [Flavobacterium micromati]|uniref:Uncharacterized protein n=1 Tax=Flavobacterium micromati TaxID=229205 RepID=A0A1M5MCI8_9FLAO|nr:hypothetical protein [Flavobacterium micromati]SHG74951.1 hypothetical protein SAMN05444372_109128 [Flavobacterium micromati]